MGGRAFEEKASNSRHRVLKLLEFFSIFIEVGDSVFTVGLCSWRWVLERAIEGRVKVDVRGVCMRRFEAAGMRSAGRTQAARGAVA